MTWWVVGSGGDTAQGNGGSGHGGDNGRSIIRHGRDPLLPSPWLPLLS